MLGPPDIPVKIVHGKLCMVLWNFANSAGTGAYHFMLCGTLYSHSSKFGMSQLMKHPGQSGFMWYIICSVPVTSGIAVLAHQHR